MASIDIGKLLKSMLDAAQGQVKDMWPEVRDYAESEFKKLGETFVTIQKLYLAGKIDKKQAKLLLSLQKNSTRSVFLAIEGMGLILAERAINAALKTVKDTVNGALGFALL
ncbi:MAG: hypothetical protein ACOX5R_10545 [bacterium]|jgi:hypothetical protein